jgi:hypothetical protein
MNRMSLPRLECQAQMSSRLDQWTLFAHCSATDFRLSIAPDVADRIYKLLDLYEDGRVRLVELEKQYRADLMRQEGSSSDHEDAESVNTQRVVIRMSYTFKSGKVQLFPLLTEVERIRLTAQAGLVHETVDLPSISLWTDYHGTTSSDVGMLVVNAVSVKGVRLMTGCSRKSEHSVPLHPAFLRPAS